MTPYRRAVSLGLTLSFLLLFPAVGWANYLIQRGDVLELSVVGIPDFKHRSVVGPDGEITLPMIQPLSVANIELAAALKLVKAELSQRVYQERTPDGRVYSTTIAPDAILLTIAEYRPIYVDGDVTKPGSQTYLPGMTVRQAVSLAGGYEIMRFRMNNPFLESADLRSEHQSMWIQYVQEQARIWRLQTELEARNARSLEEMTQAPLRTQELVRMRELARRELEAQINRNKAEREYLEQAIRTAENNIELLESRQGKDDENVKADSDDFVRLKTFSASGNLPMSRLSEARRLYLFSATQALQTSVQLSEATRKRDEAKRELARLLENRRMELLKELKEAGAAVANVRSRLEAVGQKIEYTGIIRSQLVRGASRPEIRITRAQSNANVEQADENTELMPGDTVEIALKSGLPREGSTW
jgi:polysaccharide biosynthesis/export protein